MVVHIKELEHLIPNTNDWDQDIAKTIATTNIEDYDKFLNFVITLKEHNSDMLINDEWFTVENYAFKFPADHDSIPVLYVYVVSY